MQQIINNSTIHVTIMPQLRNGIQSSHLKISFSYPLPHRSWWLVNEQVQASTYDSNCSSLRLQTTGTFLNSNQNSLQRGGWRPGKVIRIAMFARLFHILLVHRCESLEGRSCSLCTTHVYANTHANSQWFILLAEECYVRGPKLALIRKWIMLIKDDEIVKRGFRVPLL